MNTQSRKHVFYEKPPTDIIMKTYKLPRGIVNVIQVNKSDLKRAVVIANDGEDISEMSDDIRNIVKVAFQEAKEYFQVYT